MMPMYDEQALGRAIHQLRKGQGMSQADLASALSDEGMPGFYPQTIVKIEQGRRSLKFIEAMAIANIMGIDPVDLLDLENHHPDDARAMREVRLLAHAAEELWRAYRSLEDRFADLKRLADDPEADLSEEVRLSVEANLRQNEPGHRAESLLSQLTNAAAAWKEQQ
jgi:transcriptional regulator with XRE-family HTH domain